MTDDQINIAIAEACGWKRDSDSWSEPNGGRWARRVPGRDISDAEIIPNYCHDLNAVQSAWETLNEGEKFDYRAEVANCKSEWYEGATARQRAEAFLRVKGLWKEEA